MAPEITVVSYKPRKPRRVSKVAKRIPKRVQRQIKPKSKSLSKLKKEFDVVFSQWVRKDATQCFTCGKPGTAKTLQCGHFIPRQYLSVRWDKNNTRPQCVGCNIWGKGQFLQFEDNLIREIGEDIVRNLKQQRLVLFKPTRAFYEENIARYKALLL